MSKQVALIFALLMTSAAADDYRSYREAYAGVDWPKSIASAEQCQQLILSVVRQFGFTDAEVRTSRWTGEPALSVKDQTRLRRVIRHRLLLLGLLGWRRKRKTVAQ